ncbi:MAG: homoserine kinase, partial [Angustibacter sp.]
MNWLGHSVSVSVPGTSANLGPGFDCLGLALGIRDELTISLRDEPGIRLKVSGCGAGEVRADEEHLVVRAVRRGFEHRAVA